MFKKILIANRGEIAVRIIGTCRKMGIRTVAVYSEADSRSVYVKQADHAVFVGPARAQDSYLNVERLIAAADNSGCDAVHPGYGFLSENGGFARAVAAAGMTFIGPSPDAIDLLGDKIASKALASRAGVPVVPGHNEPLGDLDEAISIAQSIGFPILLKPAAGGGGRGMRVVRSADELASALSACKDETRKGFADDRIFMERFVDNPRHVEVQVLADNYGNIVHLGERECSIQRRYQKVIEETPSPAVDKNLRDQMGRVACRLAKEAGYSNAGTVEFILAADRSFYFLEMNTRLQVEHPITEMVTGLDLVELQLRIAAGEALPISQKDIALKGWAIEARICADDPVRGFLPTTGIITRYALPKGEHIRVDSGITAGSTVTIFYDSLLSKIASWGNTRQEARRGLVRALNGYHIEGLATNVDFVNAVANHPAFIRGDLSTGFLEEHFKDGRSIADPDPRYLDHMVIAAVLVFHTRRQIVKQSLKPMSPLVGSTSTSEGTQDYVVRTDDQVFQVRLEGDHSSREWKLDVNGEPYLVVTPEFEYYRRRLVLRINGQSHMFRLQYDDNHIRAFFCGVIRLLEIYTPAEWELARHMLRGRKEVREDVLRCPMPGLVTTVLVDQGEYVRKGQELLRLESMKMESGVASPCDAMVEKILTAKGRTVETDEILMEFRRS